MDHTDDPRSVAPDMRLPPAANLLWSGAASMPASGVERAFAMLAEAGRLAVELWPQLYHGEPSLRLVCDPAEPPAAPVLAAARNAGLQEASFAGSPSARATVCDLAIIDREQVGALPIALPGLVIAGDGTFLASAPRDAAARRLVDLAAQPRQMREASPKVVAETLFGPPRRLGEQARLREYQAEDPDSRPLRFEYDLLLRLIGERIAKAAKEDNSWRRASLAAGRDRGGALRTLEREFERANALAEAYGGRWRSTLAARSFLLFGANLISGLVGALFPRLAIVTLPVQIGVMGFSYLDKSFARRGHWRAKWLDYRRIAELARISRFCVIAGAPTPASSAPTWVDWRVTRAVRASAPPRALSDADALSFLTYLREVEIDPQIAYHALAHRRFRRLDARLRRAAAASLVATLVVGVGFAAIALSGLTRVSIPIMGAVGLAVVAGPGLYAALDALRGQFDVARQADRSARIGVALRALRRAITLAPANGDLARGAAIEAAAIMHEDVSTWDRVMEIV